MTTDNQLDDFFGIKNESDADRNGGLEQALAPKQSWWLNIRLLPKVLSPRERGIIGGLLIVIIGAVLSLPISAYYHYTTTVPATGGTIIEGVVGEPHLINPLLIQSNDADRDLTTLIYSGLLKYDERGTLVPDLAKSYEVSSDGLTYTVYLRDDARWHDGEPVTADDVVFTITTAQNEDFASSARALWQGVEVEKGNDTTVTFKLRNKLAQFLNNLTIGVLPAHLWRDTTATNFSLSEFNTKPIGSGPYQFVKLKKDQYGRIVSYELAATDQYYGGRSPIDHIVFEFFTSEDDVIAAFNRGDINGISNISPANLEQIRYRSRLNVAQIELPRYFAVFLNQNQNKLFQDKNLRLALAHATNRTEIIKTVLDNYGTAVDSPLLPGILDYPANGKMYPYDPARAQEILQTGGWKLNDNGDRVKNNTVLNLKITVPDFPDLVQTADILKQQWHAVGIAVTVEALPLIPLQQSIRDRSYEALLFGEVLYPDADPYRLWHSSQIKGDLGLNLALYQNQTADTLLEEARQTINPLERAKKYDDFQKVLTEDIPAIFLYSPTYLYGLPKNVRGFESTLLSLPSDRFANITHWYIDTKRQWK